MKPNEPGRPALGRAAAVGIALSLFSSASSANEIPIPWQVDARCADSGHCHLTRWQRPGTGSHALSGAAVKIFGTHAAVGHPGEGLVVIYRLSGGLWSEHQVLSSPNGPDGFFGYSLDANSGRLIVGAMGDDTLGNNTGAAFVYELSGQDYQLTETILPILPQDHAHFGSAVALGWELALIGEPGASPGGRAHLYERSGSAWSHLDTILPFDGIAFGHSVAVLGTRLFVGDPSDDSYGQSAGTVYFYREESGNAVYKKKVYAGDAAPNSAFGYSIDAAPGWLVVGAMSDDEAAVNAGAVYAIEEVPGAPWYDKEYKLNSCAPVPSAYFGWSVSIDENRIAVGARSDETLSGRVGVAYTFRWVGIFGLADWQLENELRAADGVDDDQFGSAVSVYEDRILVGAQHVDGPLQHSGAAYLFSLTRKTWGGGACAADVMASVSPANGSQQAAEGGGGGEVPPDLDLLRPLVPGEGSIAGIEVDPGAASILMWGVESGSIDLPAGELVMTDPHFLPFPLGSVLGTSGQLLEVPAEPLLAGVVVYLQAILHTPEPGDPSKLTLSNGLAARIGY